MGLIEGLISILAIIIVLVLVVYIVNLALTFLITKTGLPAEIRPLVLAIVGLVGLLLLLNALGVFGGSPTYHIWHTTP